MSLMLLDVFMMFSFSCFERIYVLICQSSKSFNDALQPSRFSKLFGSIEQLLIILEGIFEIVIWITLMSLSFFELSMDELFRILS